MDMDTDPTMHQPCRRLRKRQRTRFHVGASLPGSGRHAHRGRILHFSVLHGQAPGWGGMPQDPCSCPKRLPAPPPVDPASLRAREHGGQPALGTTSSVSALLLPCPSSALLCFLRPLFAVQREFLKLNKRYPDCRLHVPRAGGLSSVASYSKASVNWNPINWAFFFSPYSAKFKKTSWDGKSNTSKIRWCLRSRGPLVQEWSGGS